MSELAARINREVTAHEAKTIWGIVKVLLDFKFSIEEIEKMLVPTDRFGIPNDESCEKINSISSVEDLQRLVTAVLHVASWDELVAKAELMNGSH